MYFTVEWSSGVNGPATVVGAPHFEGESLVVDGTLYSEAEWQTITVMPEASSGDAPKPKRKGLYTIETYRDDL